MLYARISPPPTLAAFVEYFWFLELAPTAEPSLDFVLPDGRSELIFHYGTPYDIRKPDGEFLRQRRGLFGGQIETALTLKSQEASGMIAVRFRPAGASRFFAFSQSELFGKVIDISEVLGASGRDLTDKVVGDAQNNDERITFLVAFLEARLRRDCDPTLERVLKKIEQDGGTAKTTDLAKATGISRRQLERRFNHEVGLSPKAFSKITRFQRVLTELRKPSVSVLDTALDCGYYDQSHLIREFQAYAGVSPLVHLGRSTKIVEVSKNPENVAFVQSDLGRVS